MRTCPTCSTRYPDAIAYCPNDGTRTAPIAESVAPADPFVGLTIDERYQIEERIGEGGMGVVYRATHVVLKKKLAIKVLRGDQASDPDVLQRFVQEARASSAIGHVNIIGISDFGTTPDGDVYFAMEHLEGQTLGRAMLLGPLARERALSIFIQIASALEAAHAAGIVHRDLKPDNIFLTHDSEQEDFVKVLDFGIAKVRNASAKITRTGMVFGTPHYMSPEQAAGQPVDQRSDIYSLGVMMFEVFAGQLPFDSVSYMEVMTKHMYEAPPQPSSLRAELRGPVEDIILKALQKKPEQRHATMLQLREELERAQRVPALQPSAVSLPRSEVSPNRARPVLVDDDVVLVPKQKSPIWMLLLLGALILGAASFGIWGRGEDSVAAPATDTSANTGGAPQLMAAGASEAPSTAADSENTEPAKTPHREAKPTLQPEKLLHRPAKRASSSQ